MKDFAKTRQPSRKLKSSLTKIRNVIQNLIKSMTQFVRISLRLLLVLLFLIGVLFIILPHAISYDTNRNLLFYQYDNSDQINKIYFAFLKSDANKIEVYQLPLTYNSQLFDQQQQKVEEAVIEQLLVQTDKNQHSDLRRSTWLLGRVVAQSFAVSSDLSIEQPQDLSKVVWDQVLVEFGQKNLANATSLLRLSLFMRRSQWSDFLDLDQDQLPTTPVLPSDCPVAVINTTDISNLAATTSLILEKSGARVIRVDSNGQQLKQNQLLVDEGNSHCQLVVDALTKQILLKKVQHYRNQDQGQLLNRYRADIVLLLGNTVENSHN